MLSLIVGQEYKRVGGSPKRGVEYQGPCPVCGGNDRFHAWPEHPQGPQFWCRGCDKAGDLIEFYRWRDNLSYRDACARVGQDPRQYTQGSAPRQQQRQRQQPFTPARTEQSPQLWQEHVVKFVDWCHQQLLASPAQLSWLESRGINGGLVAAYRLGWNPADTYRPRESWGLPTQRKDNGQPKKLWLPMGLTIPQEDAAGNIHHLQIRRPDGEPRYWEINGSVKAPMVINHDATAFVVVESRLDAILLAGAITHPQVGIIAMGNATLKPTAEVHELCRRAAHLSIALDTDPITTGKSGAKHSAGAQGSLWWLATYAQATRTPMIGGKDPGDAYKSGINLHAWVMAGLPQRFRLSAANRATVKKSLSVAEPAVQEPEPEPAQTTHGQPNHQVLTLANGQEIHLVDNQELWEQLVAEGLIVFSHNELQRLQTALAGLHGEERIQAVQAAVDAKTVFPGAYIRRGEIVPGTENTEEV